MSAARGRADSSYSARVFPSVTRCRPPNLFSSSGSHGSYPSSGWSDTICARNVDRERSGDEPARKPAKRPKLFTAIQICNRSWPRFFGNARPSRQRWALLPIHPATCSPYSIPSSTAQCISAEQSGRLPSFRGSDHAGLSLGATRRKPVSSNGCLVSSLRSQPACTNRRRLAPPGQTTWNAIVRQG